MKKIEIDAGTVMYPPQMVKLLSQLVSAVNGLIEDNEVLTTEVQTLREIISGEEAYPSYQQVRADVEMLMDQWRDNLS